MKKILFTGAHHNSALALLDWIKQNSDMQVSFVWVGRKLVPGSVDVFTPEYKEVVSRDIPFYNISAGKVYRFKHAKFVFAFLKNLFLIPIGFISAFKILIKEKPDLIISFGGYIAVPIVIVGFFMRIKSVSHEQTLSVGLANQINYLFTQKIYTAWPIEYYPVNYREKMTFVGLPLKQSFIKQIQSKEIFNFENSNPVIYVTGGKNGSHVINEAVLRAVPGLISSFNIIWAAGSVKGSFDYEHIKKEIEIKGYDKNILLKEYFDESEIGKVFNTCDLVISRSGAHTIYELIYLRKPCLLVPIPWASHNEQYKNAKVVENAGLGLIIEENDLSSQYLIEKASYMLNHLDYYKESKIQVSDDASKEIGHEILQLF
jgi:UDP-N-acetylglucosamine--N-acetylmuramyl-(pentapeptide) pyrophosphoryl-undecaprenol N-acetylglucosamine transferase